MVLVSARRRDDSGAVAVVVAAFSLLLFGFAAIVVDLGVARTTLSDAQTAADAAVVSGLGALYVGDATTASSTAVDDAVRAVKKSAYDNYLRFYYPSPADAADADVSWSPSANGTVPGAACPVLTTPSGWFPKTSGTNCILFRPDDNPREIRVVMPSARAPVSFGGAVGYDGLTISGTVAEAEVPDTTRPVTTDPSCVFCVLGGGDHNLQQASLRVTGGDIWMNGDLKLSGQGDIQNVGRTVHVEASVSRSERDRVNAAVLDSPAGTIPVPPSVAMPAWVALAKKFDPCGSAGGSGRYGALTLSGGTCTLSPGLYVFTDPVTLTGGSLVGTNVTIYFACGRNGGDPQACGSDLNKPTFAKSSAARVSITAPTSSTARDGSVPGLALLFDDTLSEVVSFDGVAFDDSVVGTIYGRGVTIERDDRACAGSFDSVFVVSDVDMKHEETCLSTNVTAAANIARETVLVPALDVPVLSR